MEPTPWLDEEETRIWRGFVQAMGRINSQLTESLKADAGLTLEDYEVLVHLSEAPDQRLRMTELPPCSPTHGAEQPNGLTAWLSET